MKKLTIAVCTYNRAEILRECIESILVGNKNLNNYEILVVDNNSRDNTKEIVESFQQNIIKYIFEEKQGLSCARNRAIKECNTKLIAFIDDDTLVEGNYVNLVIDYFEKNKLVCAGGRIKSIWKEKKPMWFNDGFYSIIGETKYGNTYRELVGNEFPYGGNMIFDIEILNHIKWFDETLGMKGKEILVGEEVELCSRIRHKYKIMYLPEVTVQHRVHMNKVSKEYVNERWKQEGKATGQIISNETNIKKIMEYIKRIGILIIRDIPMYIIKSILKSEDKFYWYAKRNRTYMILKWIKF